MLDGPTDIAMPRGANDRPSKEFMAVRPYLKNGGALLDKPLDRLRKMNPLSIELYKRYKYDITRDPLEFAINNQHMNGMPGGQDVGETTLEGCYAIGEAAGTHGRQGPAAPRSTRGPSFRQTLRRAQGGSPRGAARSATLSNTRSAGPRRPDSRQLADT